MLLSKEWFDLYINMWEVEFAGLNWPLISFNSSEILQVLQVLDDENVTYYSDYINGMQWM